MGFLAWMAWTWATAIFFGVIVLCMVVLTVLGLRYPETPKRGVLGFPTTRGDRFFISLLVTAFTMVAWLRFGGSEVLWWPLAMALVFATLIFRFA